jgi:hypothetical protein
VINNNAVEVTTLDALSQNLWELLAQKAGSLADCNAALQEEATDLIDHGRPLSDQARSHAVQRLQVQLFVSLYWNTACRWPQHCFRNCVCVPEFVVVKWLGIGRRYLSHIVTEREQLTGKHCASPDPLRSRSSKAMHSLAACQSAAGKLLTQDNRSLLIQADQVECVLTRINANSSDNDSVCLLRHGSMLLVL